MCHVASPNEGLDTLNSHLKFGVPTVPHPSRPRARAQGPRAPISLYPISLYPIPYIGYPISYPYTPKILPSFCVRTKKPFLKKLFFCKYMVFLIFDAQVASNRPGTHLKRCASKFCAEWWSGHLHSSHMDPIGEKTVPYMVYPSPETLYLIP